MRLNRQVRASGVKSCLFPITGQRTSGTAIPNHRPLRRPRIPHTEQPRFLAPGAEQRQHRKLQTFADVESLSLDAELVSVAPPGLHP